MHTIVTGFVAAQVPIGLMDSEIISFRNYKSDRNDKNYGEQKKDARDKQNYKNSDNRYVGRGNYKKNEQNKESPVPVYENLYDKGKEDAPKRC